MILLYVFMITSFYGYLFFILKNWGVQSSISASAYCYPKTQNWFTLATFAYAFSAAILGVLLVDSLFLFLTGGVLGFVATAYDFRSNELSERVHMTSAQASVLLSQLALIFDFHMWYISLVSVLLAAPIFLFKDMKNKNWWQEIIVVTGLFIAIGIKLINHYL